MYRISPQSFAIYSRPTKRLFYNIGFYRMLVYRTSTYQETRISLVYYSYKTIIKTSFLLGYYDVKQEPVNRLFYRINDCQEVIIQKEVIIQNSSLVFYRIISNKILGLYYNLQNNLLRISCSLEQFTYKYMDYRTANCCHLYLLFKSSILTGPYSIEQYVYRTLFDKKGSQQSLV